MIFYFLHLFSFAGFCVVVVLVVVAIAVALVICIFANSFFAFARAHVCVAWRSSKSLNEKQVKSSGRIEPTTSALPQC